MKAFLAALFAFREPHHTQVVDGLKKLPKYPAPRRTQNAKVKSFAEWSARYDYRRVS